MALKTKQPRFADDDVVICWQSFAMGEHILVREGERLRGDHEAVRAQPGCFVLDGTPRSEWPSIWDTMPEPNNERRFQREPIPLEEAVR